MNLKVSIIIPVYNSAAYLNETINSAIAQTYNEKEIIVVDDGSTDSSFDIAKQFESENVKVVKQVNAGAAVARNNGLGLAKGQYVQFLDAGDLLSPNKIEEQVKALNEDNNKIAVCSYLQFTLSTELQHPVYPDQSRFIYSSNDPLDFLVNLWGGNGESNFIQTNCWLVPRSVIEKAGPWRNYRCPDDDGEFFARVLLGAEGIVYTPAVYNYYRMAGGANQLSSNTQYKYAMNNLLTIGLKHQYLLKSRNHQGIKKAIATQYLHYAVYNYPVQKVLSAVAFRKYKQLGVQQKAPVTGGLLFKIIQTFFGWRISRLIRYYLREQKIDRDITI